MRDIASTLDASTLDAPKSSTYKSATPKSGTAILGISADPPVKQKKFDDKHSLGFPLLSDEDHKVAEAFGVWREKKLYGKIYFGIVRSAFLIDEKGKIQAAFPKISPKDTPIKLLAALEAG